MYLINLSLSSNSQVVERERNDSKAEQEKLNTQIQEFLKEVEVIVIKLFFFLSPLNISVPFAEERWARENTPPAQSAGK